MSYDGLDRLTDAGSCSFGGDCWHRIRYNAVDNITSNRLAGVKDYAHYVYDGSNRLSQIKDSAGTAVVNLGYDVQGNLASKTGRNYSFDYGNRLRGTNEEFYRYEAAGRRVLKWRATEPGVLSIYSDSGQVMYDDNYRADTRKSSRYVYLAGSLIATRTYGFESGLIATQYHHTDALGSPVAVTNDAAQVTERTQREPYGAPIGKPNYDGYGYTGHIMDAATALVYMQQRYYDSGIGRFLSTDPVQADGNTGASFNRYWYANKNPYKFTDPDGRQSHCQFSPCSASAALNQIGRGFKSEVNGFQRRVESITSHVDLKAEMGVAVGGGVKASLNLKTGSLEISLIPLNTPGFYPDLTDAFKRVDTDQKACACQIRSETNRAANRT